MSSFSDWCRRSSLDRALDGAIVSARRRDREVQGGGSFAGCLRGRDAAGRGAILLSLGRDHRELKMTLTPVNYRLGAVGLLAAGEAQADRGPSRPTERMPIGSLPAGARKSLFVIAVGETARADHFSLNGYARPTNPELSKIRRSHQLQPMAYSCGTDTAQSVPCMFSGFGRDGFTNAKADARENLLDILKRAGSMSCGEKINRAARACARALRRRR